MFTDTAATASLTVVHIAIAVLRRRRAPGRSVVSPFVLPSFLFVVTPWLWPTPLGVALGLGLHVVWFVACEWLAPAATGAPVARPRTSATATPRPHAAKPAGSVPGSTGSQAPEPDVILRFHMSERHLHWAIGVPFIVSYTTAVILVAIYNPQPALPFRWVFSWIHRISGVCLIVLPTLAFLGHWRELRVHLHNIREAWVWGLDDVKWLLLMGPSTMSSKITLPDQGKFNAAEKINFMMLMSTYPVYIVTGVLIWLPGVALVAWLLHFSLALVATPLILGHVFMATINPDTRVGLPGMISGFVNRQWARHHYGRWYDENFGSAEVVEAAAEVDAPASLPELIHSPPITVDDPEISLAAHPRESVGAKVPPRGDIEAGVDGGGKPHARRYSNGSAPLAINRPAGQFVYPSGDDRHLVLIAGGIGISPLLSMLRRAVASEPAQPITLLYSAPREHDVAFRNELRVLAERHPHIRVVNTLTQPAGSTGLRTGRIDADLLRRHVPSLEDSIFCLCGPGQMIDGLRATLADQGVPDSHVRYEQFEAVVAASQVGGDCVLEA